MWFHHFLIRKLQYDEERLRLHAVNKLEQKLQTKSVHDQNQNRYFVKMRLRIEELEQKLKETTLDNPMPIMTTFDKRVFDSKISELKNDLKAENVQKLKSLDVQ